MMSNDLRSRLSEVANSRTLPERVCDLAKDALEEIERLMEKLADARIDMQIVLANIRYLEKALGEPLDGEDAVIVAQIAKTYGYEYPSRSVAPTLILPIPHRPEA